ncbi:MAG: phosphodiester glycosidase family protein [Planctomycetota bacterium]
MSMFAVWMALVLQSEQLAAVQESPANGVPRPPVVAMDWNTARELAPGIRLHQDALTNPRPVRRHAARIDLQQPGLRLTTTSRLDDWQNNTRETRRQTARSFLRTERQHQRPVMLAFNADAFSPWPVPFDQETETNLLGFAVSEGQLVSSGAGTPSFIRLKSGAGRMQLTDAATVADGIEVAVSGFAYCLLDGVVQPSGDDLHPRTALGLSADGRWLVVLVVDGRRHSSPGATTAELGAWLLQLGADDGINMDGGGSSTLCWWNPQLPGKDKSELLNRPVGNGLKLLTPAADQRGVSERANGNNVGVYFQSP